MPGNRSIYDVLNFRSDISPFLVHLTRKTNDGDPAKDALKSILSERELRCLNEVSDARFGLSTNDMDLSQRLRFFGAVCFTETPLNEIHCLLEIKDRKVDLEPYGLVFIKDMLRNSGVSPVLYLNNFHGDMQDAMYAFCSLITSHQLAAEKLLPLVSIFGRKVSPPGSSAKKGFVDFSWEREWRYPYSKGPFKFEINDVFIGLCPHEEIDYFEGLESKLVFVDPRRNIKWYSKKLLGACQEHDLKISVV